MIEAINTFTLSGVVYDSATKKPLPKNNMYNSEFYTSFVLVVGHSYKMDCRIPIVCVGECVDKAFVLCRKGNYVVVQGSITTKEVVDKETGDLLITTTLVATQIMPLIKTKQKSLKSFNFRDIVVSCNPNKFSEITRVPNIYRKEKTNG